ncbi:MAG: PAS domain S-box protein [Kofleriaceae bacterium]|jgi:PAS domain S-box-containing protein|nr:PAS domain S-box protein [Kofleriaceae bacterium]MBP6838767.1 PAS domain S-box protein [Kofleriaceae bacterium]MBP9206728.1 PAS domain S-box protein [Kofleriaceae bacterium]
MNRPIPNNPPSAEVLLAALEAADVGVTRVAIRGGALVRERLCPVIARSLGYTLAELVERDALDVVAPHDRPRIAAMVQRAAIAGAPAQVETWFTHRDGHLLPVEMVLHQTTSADGFDLTIVVQFLGARQRTSAAHAVADRATLVGSLAAGIAHELSNPLTFVGLNVHQLRRALERPDLDRGRLAEIAGELGGGLERVERVVRALAVFAAPARAATAIDVRALVGAALTLVRPSIERVARAEAHFDEVPRVVAEEARLGHAVLAVLLHAITGFDHDDLARQRVDVVVERRGDAVAIAISDNGRSPVGRDLSWAGVPLPSRSEQVHLGLVVAHAIMVGQGGHLAVGERLGGGMTVTLSVPAAR